MIKNEIIFPSIESIEIERSRRQRTALDPDYISGLAKQIQHSGLIHAILITPEGRLISGENRLRAFEYLSATGAQCPWEEYEDWTRIPARFAEDVSETDIAILELSENLQSKALSWQDTARAMMKIHSLLSLRDEELAMTTMAKQLGIKYSTIQANLQIAPYLQQQEFYSCTSINTALNILRRKQDRQLASIIEDTDYAQGPEEDFAESESPLESEKNIGSEETQGVLDGLADRPAQSSDQPGGQPHQASAEHSQLSRESYTHDGDRESLSHIAPTTSASSPAGPGFSARNFSFLDWAPNYNGPRFNLIHCDFPYGVNLHKSATMKKSGRGEYEDTPELFDALLHCFLDWQESFVATSAHLLFWHSAPDRERLVERFSTAGWRVWKYPIIWHKSCNTGLFPDSNRGPRHTYEMALFASRGDRKITRLVADSYSGPAVKNSGHESEKPVSMLEHFFTMLVDESTTIFDPTGGSGNALRVAQSLGAVRGLMLEINPHYVSVFNSEQKK